MELTFRERFERDMAKCKPKLGYRPIWVIAAENNEKVKVVRVRKVDSLPKFI